MFTGIIEALGTIKAIDQIGTNLTFTVQSALSPELKIDQSLSHNGACLTVTSIDLGTNIHQVTAIAETLSKTSLGHWQVGTVVNLERCLAVGGRLDGHFVQGHIDGMATVEAIDTKDGSWEITLQIDPKFAHLLVEKGSVCLDGISLTAFNVTDQTITVAIIPYTWDHTNINTWRVGGLVNIEFDIFGKYLDRWRTLADTKAMAV